MAFNSSALGFPVIGIGASAGGLEAIKSFFSHAPADSGMAYVVIQHLAPQRNTMMADLLKKHTSIPVKVISEKEPVEPDTIYLNPPDKNVALNDQVFRLSAIDQSHKGFFRIDHFFRSLAKDQGNNAVCIILSGTGSDGTLGLREVKSQGGLIIAQEEGQAEHDAMPQSAISTGLVDVVLPAESMAGTLVQFIRHPYMDKTAVAGTAFQDQQELLGEVFQILRNQTGHDFSSYKLNTIQRRIERRMAIHRTESLADYRSLLKRSQPEVDILFQELLITVTSFFRDPQDFELLKEQVIPELLANLDAGSALRIWVPGCATGEEAYSIAMIISEVSEQQGSKAECKIFASDIDKEAIGFARNGVYPEGITTDVSPERLERFFIKDEQQYRVKKHLRDMVVFADQNLIKDPPFSKVDLISCRNVLIYMNQDMHKQLLSVFYYALNKGGFLMLGASESISGFEQAFRPDDREYNLYRRQSDGMAAGVSHPQIPKPSRKPEMPQQPYGSYYRQRDVKSIAERTILDYYSHPSVVVNQNYDILFFYGNTERYLTIPTGKASLNLLNMARKTLQYKLVPALHEASQHNDVVTREGLQLGEADSYTHFDLIVHPFPAVEGEQPVMLVVFRARAPATITEDKATTSAEDSERDKQLMEVEKELQATIEQLEISNEELQSKNEELQATNEELQSSVEELETSKEEAQSTNEELSSVNAELKQKIADLNEANNDINNLLASTEIATVFLDAELCIKRYTPAASTIFNLIKTDVGRPIRDITSNINYESLPADAQYVLETLDRQEKEIQTDSGFWYAVRILPYRTIENIIDGVVITFTDVTANKVSREAYQLAEVVWNAGSALTAIDLFGNLIAWSPAAEGIYGYTKAEALQMNVSSFIPSDRKSEMLDAVTQLREGQSLPPFQTQRIPRSGNPLAVELTVSPLLNQQNQLYGIMTIEQLIV